MKINPDYFKFLHYTEVKPVGRYRVFIGQNGLYYFVSNTEIHKNRIPVLVTAARDLALEEQAKLWKK